MKNIRWKRVLQVPLLLVAVLNANAGALINLGFLLFVVVLLEWQMRTDKIANT